MWTGSAPRRRRGSGESARADGSGTHEATGGCKTSACLNLPCAQSSAFSSYTLNARFCAGSIATSMRPSAGSITIMATVALMLLASDGRGGRHTDHGVAKSSNSAALTASVRSEEHTSELQSLMRISYAVFCLKKKKKQN